MQLHQGLVLSEHATRRPRNMDTGESLAGKPCPKVDQDGCMDNARCGTFDLDEDLHPVAANLHGHPLAQILEAGNKWRVSAITGKDAEMGRSRFCK